MIFCAGSISLNILIHFFIGLNKGMSFVGILETAVAQFSSLFFFLIFGIPMCLVFSFVYLRIFATSLKRRTIEM